MFGFPYPYKAPAPVPPPVVLPHVAQAARDRETTPCPPPAPDCPWPKRRTGEAHTVRADEYGTCLDCGAMRSDRDRLWVQLGQKSPE